MSTFVGADPLDAAGRAVAENRAPGEAAAHRITGQRITQRHRPRGENISRRVFAGADRRQSDRRRGRQVQREREVQSKQQGGKWEAAAVAEAQYESECRREGLEAAETVDGEGEGEGKVKKVVIITPVGQFRLEIITSGQGAIVVHVLIVTSQEF